MSLWSNSLYNISRSIILFVNACLISLFFKWFVQPEFKSTIWKPTKHFFRFQVFSVTFEYLFFFNKKLQTDLSIFKMRYNWTIILQPFNLWSQPDTRWPPQLTNFSKPKTDCSLVCFTDVGLLFLFLIFGVVVTDSHSQKILQALTNYSMPHEISHKLLWSFDQN